MQFINNKEFLPNSYTSYRQKIGLGFDDGKLLSENKEVVLNFPFKECILEGGQDKEDIKRDEVFFNEVLAPAEIDRLLDDKVFENFKRYDKDGVHEVTELKDEDNLIIKGNNLIALHSLKKRYGGKVKLIYIDPPYNTGSDSFRYNDKFNHSSWLTFMKNRLEVARELLREDGIIFMSLDDKEAHYCKVLLDSIFGRGNFVADICHKARASVSNDKIISMSHNHLLMFAKNERVVFSKKENYGIAQNFESFINEDEHGKYKLVPVDGPGGAKKGNPYYDFHGVEGFWRYSQDTMQQMYENNRIIIRENSLSRKLYLDEVINKKKTITTWWDDKFLTSTATAELKKLFNGETVFGNPKNEFLLNRIIEFTTNENDLILDFFMGSATTQAVAMKMNRRFIGIEQMDYINSVSVPRLQKVIEGEQGGISKDVNWQGGGSFVYCELKNDAQDFKNRILKATEKSELLLLLIEAKESSFLSYRVDPNKLDPHGDFKDLSMAEQKHILMELIDNNTLYVNYSDMEDKTFAISEQVKKLNRQFYKEEK